MILVGDYPLKEDLQIEERAKIHCRRKDSFETNGGNRPTKEPERGRRKDGPKEMK